MLVSWCLAVAVAIFPLLSQGAIAVDRSHPLVLESRQGSEGLFELMKNNEKRYGRLTSIKEDIEAIEENMIQAETNFNASTAYYKAVWENYADRHGFPSFNAMVDNIALISRQAELPGADIWEEKYEKEESARIALYVSGATATLAGIGNAYMSGVYAIPLFSGPGHTWTYVQRARIYELRRATATRPRGIFSMLRRNLITVDQAKAFLEQTEQMQTRLGPHGADAMWRRLVGSLPDEINAKALALAPKLKLASRVFKLTLVADVVAGFATLIADAVIADRVREDLRAAIKDTLPLRFQVKMIQLQAAVWDQFALKVTASADVWLTMQNQVDAGNMCYANTDILLADKLDEAAVEMMNAFAAIDNQTVYNTLLTEDERSNNGEPWLYDDLSFEDTMKAVWGEEPAETAPTAEEQAALATLDAEITATRPENVAPLVAERINAANVRYVELKNSKGALWKLFGPFWSYQEGAGEANENPDPVRHRFEEVANRTDSTITLELRASNGSEEVDKTKKLEIDMAAGKIKFKDSFIDMDETRSSNLIPGNGWTASFAYVQPKEGVEFDRVYDCNRKDGWQVGWTEEWGGGHVASIMEQSRDRGVVFASGQKRNGELKASPRVTLFTLNYTVHILEEDEGIDSVYDLVPGSVVPRVTLD